MHNKSWKLRRRCRISRKKSRVLNSQTKDEERASDAGSVQQSNTNNSCCEDQQQAFEQSSNMCGTEFPICHQVHSDQSWATCKFGWHISAPRRKKKNQKEERSLRKESTWMTIWTMLLILMQTGCKCDHPRSRSPPLVARGGADGGAEKNTNEKNGE